MSALFCRSLPLTRNARNSSPKPSSKDDSSEVNVITMSAAEHFKPSANDYYSVLSDIPSQSFALRKHQTQQAPHQQLLQAPQLHKPIPRPPQQPPPAWLGPLQPRQIELLQQQQQQRLDQHQLEVRLDASPPLPFSHHAEEQHNDQLLYHSLEPAPQRSAQKLPNFDEDHLFLGLDTTWCRNPEAQLGGRSTPSSLTMLDAMPRMSPCSSMESSPFDTPPCLTPRRLSRESAFFYNNDNESRLACSAGFFPRSDSMCDV